MNILVTGGAGYIGSHTLIELIGSGHSPVVVDDFVNSSQEALRRVEMITDTSVPFYNIDLRDSGSLDKVFSENNFDAVIHFAGLKAVGESVVKPLEYYRNNLDSTLSLLEAMQTHDVKKLIFSSSATVYCTTNELPWTESGLTGVGITSPYGQTKYMIEQILRDVCVADESFEVTTLRYFNPIGAHESGLIGEDPSGLPNNLMPYVAQVAVGKLDKVRVFGDNYDTVDGTGVRDYIHVVDLARGHLAALDHSNAGFHVYNLGTGIGVSVLELISAFSKASGRNIPYEVIDRRAGDVAIYYADPAKAGAKLNWRTEKSIEDACRDSWKWQSMNPSGYR